MWNFLKKLLGYGKKFQPTQKWLRVSLILVGGLAVWLWINRPEPALMYQWANYSDIFEALRADPSHARVHIDTIKSNGQQIVKCECSGRNIQSVALGTHVKDLVDEAIRLKAVVDVQDDGFGGHHSPPHFPWYEVLSVGSGLVFIGLFVMMMKGRGGGGGLFMKMQELKPIKSTTRFADIAGIPEAQGELRVVVEFFKSRKTLEEMGGEIPRGILLVGPSGTGKTELAKAIAGEADIPFFAVKATRLVEMFVGVGAKRFSDAWAQALKNAPCVLFMDEVDAIAAKRGGPDGNNERDVTLNEILVSLDGIEGRYPILFIAATNRVEMLDDAFKSRMTRTITVPLPNKSGRKEIWRIHLAKVPLIGKGDPETYEAILAKAAELSEGMSGRAIMKVAREQLHVRCMMKYGELSNPMPVDILYEAIEAGLLGDALLSRLKRPEFRIRVAKHEAAHLIVGEQLYRYSVAMQKQGKLALDAFFYDATKLATIIPRSTGTEGVMLAMPEDGDTSQMFTWETIVGRLMTAQAGNAGEFFGTGTCTNGNAGDNRMSDQLAKMAVLRAAMSATCPRSLSLPPIYVGHDADTNPIGASQFYMESQKSHEQIDEAIGAFLWGGRFGADAILLQRLELLDELAGMLMDEGTIRREHYAELFDRWDSERPLDNEAWRRYFRPNGKTRSEIELRREYLLEGGDPRELYTPAKKEELVQPPV